jgi:hypothetical protein
LSWSCPEKWKHGLVRHFIAGLLFLFPFHTYSQNLSFPSAWEGHWEGVLYWYKTGSASAQQVPMQLLIAPTDSAAWNWQLVYGEKQADSRPYLLLPQDTSGIHWAIDERNGLILDQYYSADRLTGAFTVMQSTLVNSYELRGDSLLIEFHSFSKDPVRETETASDSSSIKVMSYRILGYQRAILRRKP